MDKSSAWKRSVVQVACDVFTIEPSQSLLPKIALVRR